MRGAFSPDRVEARAGERLRMIFRREETATCSERLVVPSLGKSVMLPPFEDVTVDLGPLPPGEYEFSCGLGVLRGRIVVRGGSTVNAEADAAPAADGGVPRYSSNSYTASDPEARRRQSP